jgi:hypothetical protein
MLLLNGKSEHLEPLNADTSNLVRAVDFLAIGLESLDGESQGPCYGCACDSKAVCPFLNPTEGRNGCAGIRPNDDLNDIGHYSSPTHRRLPRRAASSSARDESDLFPLFPVALVPSRIGASIED